MAEFCIKCGKKIGMFEGVELYFGQGKPLCMECSKPVSKLFNSLKTHNYDSLSALEEELTNVCKATYSQDISMLILQKFYDMSGKTNEFKRELESKAKEILITTTPNIEGYKIQKYFDIVCTEVIFKNSFMKSINAGIEDLGNIFSFSQAEMTGANELIEKARNYAIDKFKTKVATLGANAVVGVEFESSFGSDIVKVSIFGTAVEIEKQTTER